MVAGFFGGAGKVAILNVLWHVWGLLDVESILNMYAILGYWSIQLLKIAYRKGSLIFCEYLERTTLP